MTIERFEKVKKLNEIRIAGTKIDITTENDSVRELRIAGEGGELFIVKPGESYMNCLHILAPAKPKMKKVWRVSGELNGLPYSREFAEQHAADNHRDSLMHTDSTKLEISESEVPEDEDSEVVEDRPL